MQEHGIEWGEMNMVLLKKIENSLFKYHRLGRSTIGNCETTSIKIEGFEKMLRPMEAFA